MAKLTFHQKLTFHARHSLKEASLLAGFTKNKKVEVEHLLLAIFLEKGSLGSILLRNMGFETETLSSYCLKKADSLLVGKPEPTLSEEVKSVMRRAYSLANEFQYPYVGTEHFVYALMELESDSLDALIETLNIDEKKIESTLAAHTNFDNLPSVGKILDTGEAAFPKRESKTETPFLDQFAVNVNNESREKGEVFIGREEEIDRLVQILSRKTKNNPLLVGEPGVGKTALVSALASRIEKGDVPYYLLEKKIFSLDLALVVAGTNFRGEFENRLKEIVKEAENDPNIILFIDEIHTLVGAGNTQGGLDAANILKPGLARGDIRCIGATTLTEFKKYIEKDSALERRFQTVEVNEPTPEEAQNILQGVRGHYENFHGVSVPTELVSRAVQLSVRYLPDRFLPDKALDILDESLSLARHSIPTSQSLLTKGALEKRLRAIDEQKQAFIRDEAYDEAAQCKIEEDAVKADLKIIEEKIRKKEPSDLPALQKIHVDITLARMAKIPLDVIANDTSIRRVKRLEAALKKELIGQDKAAEEIVHALMHGSHTVRSAQKPLASFLFLGPTGVGKTYSAKLIAEHFFDQTDALIRFDMSEFGERHSVAQMLGAPAGYVGFGEGGKLTEAVRRRPYSVVLFDEIDKAHPDVWNILLQILDEAKLTDAEGRVVDFRNTVIILTSNQGSEKLGVGSRIGFDSENKKGANLANDLEQEQKLIKHLQKIIRPELFARFEHVLVFNPLLPKHVRKIIQNEFQSLKQSYALRGVKVVFDPKVTTWLVNQCQTLDQGARFIHKKIKKEIERPLLSALLQTPETQKITCTLSKEGNLVCKG